MISVIIPTYKAPEYLDLCINSIISGQSYINEIIVVVDGTFDLNKEIISKYKDKIVQIIFDENYGLIKATNHGVYAASNDLVLVVNDDNVFPKNWDKMMLEDFSNDMVLSPNQIEPYPSMFKQFHMFDFGKNIKEFNLDQFQSDEVKFRKNLVSCNFYHFVSVTYKSPEKIKESKIKEAEAFEYFKYKWGNYPIHDPNTNLKSI